MAAEELADLVVVDAIDPRVLLPCGLDARPQAVLSWRSGCGEGA